MISDRMQEALNKQVTAEFHAAHLYLSMAAHFQSLNLDGFAAWMRAQWLEETGHAMMIFNFINDRGGKVALGQIDAPPTAWESPLAAFEAAYGHEQKVTAMIGDLVELAAAEKDHATGVFLQWFVTEQVEEEDHASTAVEKLKLVQGSPNGLFMMDRAMGARPVKVPPSVAGGGDQ